MDITNLVLAVSGVIAVVLGVWALIDLWRGPYTVVAKIGWTFGILIIPIIMSIVYLVSRPSGRLQQEQYTLTDSAEDINRRYGRDGDL